MSKYIILLGILISSNSYALTLNENDKFNYTLIKANCGTQLYKLLQPKEEGHKFICKTLGLKNNCKINRDMFNAVWDSCVFKCMGIKYD